MNPSTRPNVNAAANAKTAANKSVPAVKPGGALFGSCRATSPPIEKKSVRSGRVLWPLTPDKQRQ